MTLGSLGKDTIEALKVQPLLLVMVILDVLVLGVLFYTVSTAQKNHNDILKLALEKCGNQ